MLASALPVEGDDFKVAVDSYLDAIKKMPREAKLALKCAYVFSRKAPREEREDLFQDLALAVLKVKTPDEKLAYTVARFDWLNWWRDGQSKLVKTCGYSGRDTDRHHATCEAKEKPAKGCKGCAYAGTARELVSIDTVSEDNEGNPRTIGELIVGEVEFERKLNGKMDAEKIYSSLPAKIKPIVDKRLLGLSINRKDRNLLDYWIKTHGYKLLLVA